VFWLLQSTLGSQRVGVFVRHAPGSCTRPVTPSPSPPHGATSREKALTTTGSMEASRISVRPLTPADTAAATAVWADAMLAYDKEFIRQFIAEKLAGDMMDAHASYVAVADGSSGFWVACTEENGEIVGCVGARMLPAATLGGASLPPGKDYLQRIKDKDGVPMGTGAVDGPLWGPLGADGSDGPAMELMRMAVSPAHRGMGVARALVQEVATFAQGSGCPWVVLTTAREMLPAVAAYKQMGFSLLERPKIMAFAGRPEDLLR